MKNKINSFPLLFLISILFYGCYGTRTITFNDKAISKKESILVYQNENVFELLNFKFDGNVLSGALFNSSFPDLPKSRKVKWLEVYIEPDFYLPIKDDTNNLVRIPYASIYKIDKTRFRAEYGLLIIPIWLIGGITIYYLGGLLQH